MGSLLISNSHHPKTGARGIEPQRKCKGGRQNGHPSFVRLLSAISFSGGKLCAAFIPDFSTDMLFPSVRTW